MKYFLLLLIALGPHAKQMREKGRKNKESKYLLVKIKDRFSNKNETGQIIDGKI